MRALLIACSAADAPEKIALARECGVGLQLQAFYQPAVLEDPAPEVARHRALLDGFPYPLTVHGAFSGLIPSAPDPQVRRAVRARIRQAHGIARALGATDVVQHFLYSPIDRWGSGYLERSLAFWREILADLPAGLTLHMENTFERAPAEFVPLVEALAGDPRPGVCLDIGHAHGLSASPPSAWIRALGSAITCVHLHDNDGGSDQHLPLGEGTLPLRETLDLLEETVPGALWIVEEGEARRSLAWLARHGYAPARILVRRPALA